MKFLDIPFEAFESANVSKIQDVKSTNFQHVAQSDPIHESSYDAEAVLENHIKARKYSTPEQEFEWAVRKKSPRQFEIDQEIKDTLSNIKVAEAITGLQMPGPDSPKEIAKDLDESHAVGYYLAGPEDEDEDTVETRKSIELAEAMLKRKFSLDGSKQEEIDVAKSAVNQRIVLKDFKRAGIDFSNEEKDKAKKAAGKESKEKSAEQKKKDKEAAQLALRLKALKIAKEKKRLESHKKHEEEDVEIPATTREQMSFARVPTKKSQIPQAQAELHFNDDLFGEE